MAENAKKRAEAAKKKEAAKPAAPRELSFAEQLQE